MSTIITNGIHVAAESGVKQTPDSSDLSFKLDGTILNSSGTYYFVDKVAGANFLITNYDFPIGWTKGYPLKTKATISAPAGNATLIAADTYNLLTLTGGTGNGLSGIYNCSVKRLQDDPSDTYTSNWGGLSIDCHGKIQGFGSRFYNAK